MKLYIMSFVTGETSLKNNRDNLGKPSARQAFLY